MAEIKSMPAEVADYLRIHHVMTLSTSSFTGMPHADTTVYASDDMRVYFFATEGSDLVRNVTDSRHVSFTIDDYTTDWRKVRELQGVCRCKPATEQERDWAMVSWRAKFGHSASPGGVMFAMVPHEMHFVDYDYATVTGSEPAITSRSYIMQEGAEGAASAPVATTLDHSDFEAGAIIFRPGDSVGIYYVVLSGEVEIRGEGFGADQTVTRVGVGQMFGDRAALRGQRGALTAHAVTDTSLLAVQRDTIRDLLQSDSSA
jgi:uncharacterized protein YhbP (UPF0306 family)